MGVTTQCWDPEAFPCTCASVLHSSQHMHGPELQNVYEQQHPKVRSLAAMPRLELQLQCCKRWGGGLRNFRPES